MLTKSREVISGGLSQHKNPCKLAGMEKISEEKVLEGIRFDVHRMTLRGDDGQTYHREVIRHPGAVVIIPLLDDNTVVLINNRRPTVDRTLVELPAGTRDPGETPETTARRELIEETGYEATSFELIHEFYSAPGISDEIMWLYVARGLTAVGANREAVEDITNRVVDRSEASKMIQRGDIYDGKTLVGLYAWLSQ
jgi:ADP-ribose pyrophosphatase